MHRRTALRIAAVGVSFAAAFAPAVAYAGSHHDPKPRDACTSEGPTTQIVTKDGPQAYRCTKVKPGCLIWAWVYNPDTPKHHKTYGPPTCPACQSNSPSPSATPTAGPTSAAGPSGTASAATPTTPAAGAGAPGGLPITGPGLTAGITGAALLLSGAFLRTLARRRRTP